MCLWPGSNASSLWSLLLCPALPSPPVSSLGARPALPHFPLLRTGSEPPGTSLFLDYLCKDTFSKESHTRHPAIHSSTHSQGPDPNLRAQIPRLYLAPKSLPLSSFPGLPGDSVWRAHPKTSGLAAACCRGWSSHGPQGRNYSCRSQCKVDLYSQGER